MRGEGRPRLSGLYESRREYDRRVEAALEALVAEGWVLERDREYERAAAARRWEWAAACDDEVTE